MKTAGFPHAVYVVFFLTILLIVGPIFGWGRAGHLDINRVAAESLPADMPAFLHTPAAVAEIEYLGPEPDMWRSKGTPELSAAQAPEHFIDLEWAELIGPLPRNRYDFIRAIGEYGVKHSEMADKMTPEKIGLLPYEANEVYQRLEVDFRAYRDLSAARRDTKPVEAAILFDAGCLGHYAGDGSQPLHTTIQYNGWVGPNPHGYTTGNGIHSQFESIFVEDNIKAADFAPLVGRPHVMKDVFADFEAYLRHSNSLAEKVYQLEKAGGFSGAGSKESVDFTRERLAAGATMLRDLIYTAWVKSAEIPSDAYLIPKN